MTTIMLEPRSRDAVYHFPLEGDPPKSVLGSESSLGWKAHISDISAIPSPVAFARLTSGGLLRDLKGFVTFSVATAECNGHGPRWRGCLSYRGTPEEHFNAHLRITDQMFSRLVELAKVGAIPRIEVTLDEAEGLKTSIMDGRLDEWDNVKVPDLAILWCEFTATFVSPARPRAEEKPLAEDD